MKSKQCFFLLIWVSLDKCFWSTLSSCSCSSIKFCLPDKIINFTGLVDGQENDEKYISILIENESKYTWIQRFNSASFEGNLQRKEIKEDRMNRTLHTLDQLEPVSPNYSFQLLQPSAGYLKIMFSNWIFYAMMKARWSIKSDVLWYKIGVCIVYICVYIYTYIYSRLQNQVLKIPEHPTSIAHGAFALSCYY